MHIIHVFMHKIGGLGIFYTKAGAFYKGSLYRFEKMHKIAEKDLQYNGGCGKIYTLKFEFYSIGGK